MRRLVKMKDEVVLMLSSDEKGKFIASQNKSLPFVADDMMAEALAIREGLCLAQHIGCN
jgi:hypothetical protein